jgi:hypothetical protein
MATQDSMVAGLFTTPEQYQEQQRQALYNQAVAEAKLDPYQQARVNLQTGVQGLAQTGAGMMGVEDPQMKARSVLQELAGKYDTNTSGGVAALATELQQRGMQQQAMILGQRALDMRKTEAEAQAKTAEKLTNEQKNAAAGADASGAERGTTAWSNTYKTELARLTAGNKGANIKEIGVAEGTRQPVYFDVGTDTQFVVRQDPKDPTKQVRVPFNGGVDRTTAKTTVDARNVGENAFVKQLAELDAKRVADAANTREAAIGELDNLQKMANLNKQEMVTGTFASGRTAVGNLFGTIGIASNKDKLAVANSEQYEKYAGNLLLDKIKKLGTNPSNTDREFIAKIIPQLENSAQARQELINYMAQKAQAVISETTRLDDYAREKRGLTGFKPTIPLVSTGGVAGLSDDELIRQIKAEREKRGAK